MDKLVVDSVEYLETPDKSQNDKKLYKTLRLSNGLLAILVSDPSPVPHDGLTSSSQETSAGSCAEEESESDTSSKGSESENNSECSTEEGDEKLAACALMIDVGSSSDPQEYQGLSHFLEHMIFMGSEKFPLENAFDSHVKKCGGFDNAFTEHEETVFYFECSETHLNSTIEIFSELFKKPLMKKDAMTRERNAVESEFQNTVLDDECRRDQILASLGNALYPNSTFAWGNLKSLKENVDDDVLYRKLHEFRERHYSSHRMYVCVQARLPIDELECIVVNHFNDIPNNNLPGDDVSDFDYKQAFLPSFFNEVYFVKPIKKISKLELTWVLPSCFKWYKCKPEEFISYLVGYEGEGSLCSYLRKKLWALELIAGVGDSGFDSNSVYSLFNICIFLTDKGFNHLKEVLEVVFAYIKQLATCKDDDLITCYKEIQFINETGFRFEPQIAAMDNVQEIVLNMKYYPPKDVLTGGELYFEYDSDLVRRYLDHLNKFNFNIMITSENKYDGIVYDKKEKWFGTDYTSIPIPPEWKAIWDNCPTYPELFVPKPNIFVAHDFQIFFKEDQTALIPAYPKKIMESNICELWFREDDKFLLPNAMIYIHFISPLIKASTKNQVIAALYVEFIKYDLVETLYPATIAGISFSFYASEKGFVLKTDGYNEKLHLVVDAITNKMAQLAKEFDNDFREEQLECFKMDRKKAYFNALIKPSTLNKDIQLNLLENVHWSLAEKFMALPSITLENVKEFAENCTNHLHIQTLMQGNLLEETALKIMNSVLKVLDCQGVPDKGVIQSRTREVPKGIKYLHSNVINPVDQNSVVCNFYQIGPTSLFINCILDLLMMFVEQPLFDQLRTKEQLGYNVSGAVKTLNGIVGYSITVQSQEDKFTAQYVEERIEAFRNQMLRILNGIDEEEYEHVRRSLITIKQVVDTSLEEEVDRNWGEITRDECLFDRRKREVEILRNLNKQDIVDFLLANEATNMRKLSIQVIGYKKAGEFLHRSELTGSTTDQIIETNIPQFLEITLPTLNKFKSEMNLYPVTKIRIDESDR